MTTPEPAAGGTPDRGTPIPPSAQWARLDALEIEVGAYLTVVTDHQKETAAAIAGQFGVPVEDLLSGPHNLVGSVDFICEELERRLERAETAAALHKLAAGIAHNRNNPLTTVRTFLELLPSRWESDEEFRDDYYRLVLGETERMVREMQAAVASGTMEMDRFRNEVSSRIGEVAQVSEKLGRIIEPVQAVTRSLDQVHEGMETQSQGARQIRDAMEKLRDDAGESSASLAASTVSRISRPLSVNRMRTERRSTRERW